MLEVVLVNLINFQEYILDNIKQLLLLKYKVTVIISDNLLPYFTNISNITIILTSTLDDNNYNSFSLLDNSFRGGFWRLCSQRLFYLYSYIKKHDSKNVLHIENDVLLYNMLDENLCDSKIWITMDAHNRCIPGIMFVPNYTLLTNLIHNYQFDKNDMENLSIFFHTNPDKCKTFPIIMQNNLYNKNDIYSSNYNIFNMIFDAAAMGQYIGGVDPKNIAGDTSGFINETCVVNYSIYKFIWKDCDFSGIYRPYIVIDNNEVPIMNLHIHSKNLSKFSSTNKYIESNIIMSDRLIYNTIPSCDYITGEQFQEIADVYLGFSEDFNFNPRINNQRNKHVIITSITSAYNNPRIIFCYSHRLNILKTVIHYFINPFILITHNSDENIYEDYESLLYSNKIIRWYAQNVSMTHRSIHILPIGIANSMWPHGNLDVLKSVSNSNYKKTKDFYFYFNESTNYSERNRCRIAIEKKGLIFGSQMDYQSYLQELSQYKFAICPPGNGIDCHRLWECYYLNVIPILLKSPFTLQLQTILPCILLDDWNNFDASIISQYSNLYTQLHRQSKYLTLRHYRDEIMNYTPKVVWFVPRGRTGNNLFQYIAAEVIKYIYGFDIVLPASNISESIHQIDCKEYDAICNKYINDKTHISHHDKEIALNGYFQKSFILLKLRNYILKYFNSYNTTRINDTYTIADFNNCHTKHIIESNNSLVLHLRLDDFIHENSPPEIFNKTDLGSIIDTLIFDKLYILSDKINHDWEKRYIQYFIDKYDAICLSGSFFDDFNLMRITPKLITSNSTFSWIAAYLGNNGEVHIPYSDFHKENQVLKECHNNSIVHYGLSFATDLLV
jgi:hypothetical protein